MVALYKDPKGENVFDKYGTPSFKSQQQKQQQADSTIGTGTIRTTDPQLQKRIQELENIVDSKQVYIYIPMHIIQTSACIFNRDTTILSLSKLLNY